MTSRHPNQQHGAGSLPVLLLLLLGLLLFLLHSQQALIAQTRHVAQMAQGAAALEAAEAGLAWTIAELNQPGGADTSVRERLLAWPEHASVQARHAASALACTQDDAAVGRWACRWADSSDSTATVPTPAADGRAHPAWTLTLADGPLAEPSGARRTTVAMHVTGCSHATPGCGRDPEAPGDDVRPDASRHLHQVLALLGDIVNLPGAALSAGGRVTLGAGSRVVQAEPGAAAIAVEAGGAVDLAVDSQVIGAPGRPRDDAVRSEQAALQGTAARWWWHFRAANGLMRELPSLRHVACPASGCSGTELSAAMAEGGAGARAYWIEGGLTLDGGTWGSAERPLLMVVDGPARLLGAVQADGWLLAETLDWQGGSAETPRGLWQGSISTWGDARLGGAVDLLHRPTRLARLRGAIGTWTALPGSWRDHGP